MSPNGPVPATSSSACEARTARRTARRSPPGGIRRCVAHADVRVSRQHQVHTGLPALPVAHPQRRPGTHRRAGPLARRWAKLRLDDLLVGTRDAKTICTTCEVRGECLEYALQNDERFGIWGGLSER